MIVNTNDYIVNKEINNIKQMDWYYKSNGLVNPKDEKYIPKGLFIIIYLYIIYKYYTYT